jgi:tRNA pseudouridine38-40 synthase
MKITANAFLLHMVRNIMGALMDVGENIQPVSWPDTILASKDRSTGSKTAPAAGLYLTGVAYDSNFGIPMDTQLDFFTLG